MQTRTRNVIGLVLAALLLLGGGIGALTVYLARQQRKSEPPAPTLRIPPEYKAVRLAPMHQAHLAKHVKCAKCHDLPSGDFRVQNPLQLCDKCHKKISRHIHGASKVAEAPDCMGCHEFKPPSPGAAFAEATDCMKCHSRSFGKTVAVVRHADVKCLDCHEPHKSPELHIKNCLDCHKDQNTPHGGPDLTIYARCLSCHDAHQDTPAAQKCGGCHSTRQPKVSVDTATFHGHDQCTTCHAGHKFTTKSVKQCTDCHQNKIVLASDTAKPHDRCTNCHEPHNVMRSAIASCSGCHKKISSNHPKTRGPCTGCHVPHPRRPSEHWAQHNVVWCSSCHTEASSDTAFHAGGELCTSCHRPHRFDLAGMGRNLCAKCHRTEATLTSTLAGHSKCTGCHQSAPHEPQAAPLDCGNCHETQVATAPTGHETCTNCHRPHNGSLTSKGAACTPCHTDKAGSLHGQVGEGCTSCHRPHGPKGPTKPPFCTTCHTPSKLPSLHSVPQHQQCLKCHAPHEKAPSGTRATCLQCHKDRADHQPQASVCTGCHVFRTSAAPAQPSR